MERGWPVNRAGTLLRLFRHTAGTATVAALLGGAGLLAAADKPAPPTPEGGRVEPFKIAVEEAVLRDLNDRLGRTRWPDQIDGTGWEYGVPLAYMKDLVGHWRTKYDWRAQEKKLNQFDQFVTRIDGLDVHFIHVRSKEKDALPLVVVHGWPGSFYEFYK